MPVMNYAQSYEMLKQMREINPQHTPLKGDPTYFIVELQEDETIEMLTTIVDPHMTTLELSNIISDITPNVAGVATHVPLDEDMWKKANHSKVTLIHLLRFLCYKASIKALAEEIES
jgi:hypothetical protein